MKIPHRALRRSNDLSRFLIENNIFSDTSGFQNLYYFSRYFKKSIGISPTEYQRK
ncbi:MAG: AraC family transcriptional regulator [Clostridia bacterium]|nr:AraC family transcriptional regulator [Clostridia bacterium]